MLKIIIGDDADDQSVMPEPGRPLRAMPERKLAPAALAALTASATTAADTGVTSLCCATAAAGSTARRSG